MKTLLRSSYLHQIEILKSKLHSRNLESYIKNEFVNNVAVFPISQNYELLVSEIDYDKALEIAGETVDLNDSSVEE